jgi:hypothetical protein
MSEGGLQWHYVSIKFYKRNFIWYSTFVKNTIWNSLRLRTLMDTFLKFKTVNIFILVGWYWNTRRQEHSNCYYVWKVVSTKSGNFLTRWENISFLKIYSAPWSYFGSAHFHVFQNERHIQHLNICTCSCKLVLIDCSLFMCGLRQT